MDIEHFLYHFLYKYFDTSFAYGDMRDEYCSNAFEWNLEPNIYTYNTVESCRKKLTRVAVFWKPISTTLRLTL